MADRYRPEPAPSGDRAARDGVLLVNLGTPVAPTASAVRRYLAEFLADPRVVEIPRALWLPILYGVILPLRPASSARKYAEVWTDEGSPLAVHTQRQAALLADAFAGDGPAVEYAMRYGAPAMAGALDRLRARGCERILVVPLYPQYAASTTASVVDAVCAWLASVRNVPELRFVRQFHDHPAYLAALATGIREHWERHGRGDRLVMSFHGLPRSAVLRGDPYERHCRTTARLLGEALHELIESELFGHEKGSFTGAFEKKKGKFELADTGTLFLDEIGDMSLQTQSKVLRVIETQDFQRVGGNTTIKVDVRIIAATNKDLTEEVKKGKFRDDLFFRLNVVPIAVPPLREHKEDIRELSEYYFHRYNQELGTRVSHIDPSVFQKLTSYHWPGNVRELANTINRSLILCKGEVMSAEDIVFDIENEIISFANEEELENNLAKLLDPLFTDILRFWGRGLRSNLLEKIEKFLEGGKK